MRERMHRPRGLELLVGAVAALDAAEVDTPEVAQRRARLGGEVRVVAGPAFAVELHVAANGAYAHELRQKAGAVHADAAAGEVACDRGQATLFLNAVFMPREADRCQSAHY
jgi:hypothetical protein